MTHLTDLSDRDIMLNLYLTVIMAIQIGRASCRERVSSPV